MNREEIRNSLRSQVLGPDSLVEAKSADVWWDKLPSKQKSKLSGILGLAKGKDKKPYAKLDAASQDEIASYFRKHKGKVESVEDDSMVVEGVNRKLYRAAQAAEANFEKALRAQFGSKYQDKRYTSDEFNAKTIAAFEAKVKADAAWLKEMRRAAK